MKQHLWHGEWVGDAEAEQRLAELDRAGYEPPADPLDPELVIAAGDRIARALAAGGAVADRLAGSMAETPTATAAAMRELELFLRAERLRRTLHTELGDGLPLAARPPEDGVVEAWQPLGLLAHVVPANVATAGPVSLVEGLLSGNANIVKTSARRGLLTQQFAAELIASEPALAPYATVLRFESGRRSWLRQLCHPADGIVVWGSEEAVASVADLVPAGARLVVWGPKISIGYLTAAAWKDRDVLAALAHDICALDQQACTSPQVVYLDTADDDELWAVAGRLAEVLADVDGGYDQPRPDLDEQAEITNTVLVARHEEHLGLSRVWSGPAGRWHVLAEVSPVLRASPLYRTIWVKPLPRASIVPTLRPMRRYLQTAGVCAADAGSPGLVRALIAAGADRVTPLGSMHESYPGEPHDGEYALRRYSRRVSLRLSAS